MNYLLMTNTLNITKIVRNVYFVRLNDECLAALNVEKQASRVVDEYAKFHQDSKKHFFGWFTLKPLNRENLHFPFSRI